MFLDEKFFDNIKFPELGWLKDDISTFDKKN